MALGKELDLSLMVYLGIEKEKKRKKKTRLPCFRPVTEREQVHMHLGYISIFTHSVHTVE